MKILFGIGYQEILFGEDSKEQCIVVEQDGMIHVQLVRSLPFWICVANETEKNGYPMGTLT